MNRPDLILLLSPFCLFILYKTYKTPKVTVTLISIASLPILIWTLFSLFYYGFPFPNTAYAKLGTGIPSDELIAQGGHYFLDSIARDPILMVTVILGVFTGFKSKSPNIFLAIGVGLYLFYVCSIGGDFMSGRFFTAPLLVACIILSRTTFTIIEVRALSFIVLVFGLGNANYTLLSSSFYSGTIGAHGIADERGVYFQRYGLIIAKRNTFASPEWKLGTKSILEEGVIGFVGINRGPSTHLVDVFALADPLLARLPATYNKDWRIGHFRRQIPTDYFEGIQQDRNLLFDPKTKVYYDALRVVTRDPLFSMNRLGNIMRLNLNLIPKPDADFYKFHHIARSSISLTSLQERTVSSGPWNAAGNIPFERELNIRLPSVQKISSIDVSLDNNDVYRVEYLHDGVFHNLCDLESKSRTDIGMSRYTQKFDRPTPETEQIRIIAVKGDGYYSVGHFRINSSLP